jgi:hypothetical protein
MLAYVMCELNKLNNKFHENYIDFTSLGETIDVTILNTFKRWFLRSDTFHMHMHMVILLIHKRNHVNLALMVH